MTFKMTNVLQIITGIIVLFSVSLLSAEVIVNSSQKNDKVVSRSEVAGTDSAGIESKGRSGPTGWVLHAEQWELARSGESILSLPILNEVMNAWLQDKVKKIEIRYPGGEEGEFWVQQLSDWLVSLGLPSERMVLTPGSGADDVIRFDLIK